MDDTATAPHRPTILLAMMPGLRDYAFTPSQLERLGAVGDLLADDSVDDFDDSLPDSCQPKDFFTVFGAAFKRQSRWSENKPVPDLGIEAEEYEAVAKFYDFWYGFKSWREFPHPDEDDPEV